jgi:uncharacterized membrane protein HdeD (DUF308 family)
MKRRAAAVLLVDPRQVVPVLLVRAVLAVALGLVALIWPGITLVILAWAFGIYAIIDGVTQIVDGIRRRDRPRWWLSLLLGLLGLVAGAIALVWPGITAIVLAILVGAWAVVTGIGEAIAGGRLLRNERRGGLLLLAGLLSVVAGLLILIWPVPGAIVLALLIGWFAVLYGIMLATLALQLRSAAQSPASSVPPSA